MSAGGYLSEDNDLMPRDLITASDFLGADPIDPEKWVTSSDHPETVIRRSESGEVGIAFEITENGRVVNCRVTSESSQSRYDNVPCKLVMRRARFKPQAGAKEIQPGARGEMRFRFDDANR
jgi:TonB family protein